MTSVFAVGRCRRATPRAHCAHAGASDFARAACDRPADRDGGSGEKKEIDTLAEANIIITAGMVGFPGEDYSTIARIRQTGGYMPDDLWPERREMTAMAAAVCKQFGIKLLTGHVGFIPPSSSDKYRVMVDRVTEIATSMEKEGVMLGMETGQEEASELLQFINDVRSRNLFVNFDPANMILYGAGDPIEAIATLGRHIRHVHLKDAEGADRPGANWGSEVAFGSGDVPVMEFFDALKSAKYTGPLIIEREAGANRVKDIQFAIETLGKTLGNS